MDKHDEHDGPFNESVASRDTYYHILSIGYNLTEQYLITFFRNIYFFVKDKLLYCFIYKMSRPLSQ